MYKVYEKSMKLLTIKTIYIDKRSSNFIVEISPISNQDLCLFIDTGIHFETKWHGYRSILMSMFDQTLQLIVKER